MRHKSSGPFEGRIQGRAPPPSVSALCRKVVIVSESSAGQRLGLSFWTWKPCFWVSRVMPLLRAKSLLYENSKPRWPTDSQRLSVELLREEEKNLFFKQRPVIVSWWSLAIGTKVRQTNKRTAVSISSKTPSSVLNRRRASRPAYSFSLLLLRWLESRSIRLTSRKKLWIFALCKCWRSGRGKPACDDRF